MPAPCIAPHVHVVQPTEILGNARKGGLGASARSVALARAPQSAANPRFNPAFNPRAES